MRIITPLLFVAILVINGPVVYGASTADLQAQITALLQQVQVLQAQLQGTRSQPPPVVLTFNLRLGSTDAATNGEVSKLQQFLAKDSAIYPEGLITGYFGSLTKAAVKRWQTKNGIQSVGAVGPVTRGAIKQATVVIAPPVASSTVTYSQPPSATSTTSTSTASVSASTTATTTSSISSTSTTSTSTITNAASITLSPSSSRVGDYVTITGSNFTASGNDIHFGIGGVKNVKSGNNGTMITFQVPSAVGPCDFVNSADYPACAAPSTIVNQGQYTVYVTNTSGTSASTTFTIIAISYPAVVNIAPSTGRTGDLVTLSGSGFTQGNNEVHFGAGGINNVSTLAKVKGTVLKFNVPASVNPCDFTTGLPPCSGQSYQVGPGDYAVYIVNPNGKTNSVLFTVY